ncbi:MAG: hypothetical protein K2Z25_24605 [Beijerinckiaceae bacterium]|nr:hypothetical protein [Beijerinckiaceae bacterium]
MPTVASWGLARIPTENFSAIDPVSVLKPLVQHDPQALDYLKPVHPGSIALPRSKSAICSHCVSDSLSRLVPATMNLDCSWLSVTAESLEMTRLVLIVEDETIIRMNGVAIVEAPDTTLLRHRMPATPWRSWIPL